MPGSTSPRSARNAASSSPPTAWFWLKATPIPPPPGRSSAPIRPGLSLPTWLAIRRCCLASRAWNAYSDDLRSRRDLTISDLLSVILGRDLRPLNLQLTLTDSLQRIAFEALGGQAGSVVALDPTTGAILAMVSTPSYDPNLLVGVDATAHWQTLLADPGRPLADRATRELYPPGSTFKTVVSAAAFETGLANPESPFPDEASFQLPGSTATVDNAGGTNCSNGVTTSLLNAFVRSCNATFARLAIAVGAEPIGQVAEGLGFNQELPFTWTVAESALSPTSCRPTSPRSVRAASVSGTCGPRRCRWRWWQERSPTKGS